MSHGIACCEWPGLVVDPLILNFFICQSFTFERVSPSLNRGGDEGVSCHAVKIQNSHVHGQRYYSYIYYIIYMLIGHSMPMGFAFLNAMHHLRNVLLRAALRAQ